MNIQHSSRSDLWYTPDDILDAVRKVLGIITLDPASDDDANDRVRATHFLDEEADGLVAPWPDPTAVYLNPPGGKRGNKSLAGLFWTRLMLEHRLEHLGHAIFMAFSAEQLQSTQKPDKLCLLDFPFCVPAKRIRFVSPAGKKNSPSHCNVIVYVPGLIDRTGAFVRAFSPFGRVRA